MRSGRYRRTRGGLAAIALLSMLLAGNCGGIRGVEVSTVTAGLFVKKVVGVGRLEALEPCYVYPEASGPLASINVKDGDLVQAGQVLASIDRQTLELELKKAESNYLTETSIGDMISSMFCDMGSLAETFNSALESLESQGRAAGEALARYAGELSSIIDQLPQEIRDTARQVTERIDAESRSAAARAPSLGRISSAGYPSSAARADEARAEVALMELEHARSRLANADIRAPVSGYVFYVPMGGLVPEDLISKFTSSDGGFTSGLKSMSGGLEKVIEDLGMDFLLPQLEPGRGSMLKEDRPAFMIAGADRFQLNMKVEEADVPLVATGQTVSARIDAVTGKVVKGRVTYVARRPATNLSGATEYEVTAELECRRLDLRIGYSASAEITVAEKKKAVLVPLEAVLMDPSPHVFVMKDGRPRRRDVELGLEDGGRVEVAKGLIVGDEVVVKGAAGLRRGGGA